MKIIFHSNAGQVSENQPNFILFIFFRESDRSIDPKSDFSSTSPLNL